MRLEGRTLHLEGDEGRGLYVEGTTLGRVVTVTLNGIPIGVITRPYFFEPEKVWFTEDPSTNTRTFYLDPGWGLVDTIVGPIINAQIQQGAA